MQPDDLSIPRGDNKIKEKLNLHLKKRLQETGKSLSSSAAEPPPLSSSSSTITCPPVSPAAAAAGPSSGSKTKKQKTKHSPSTSFATSAPAGCSFNISAAAGSCSNSKNPEHLMLSPGALGGGNSNDTTNSSFNSVDLDPDANLSNDGQERAAGEKSGSSKVNSKPDIFTLLLNEKKSSLMRDPEVITFLKDLMEKRDNS